jgi:hypothetical protein
MKLSYVRGQKKNTTLRKCSCFLPVSDGILQLILNTLTQFFLLALNSILLQVEAWLQIAKTLMPDGRIMVNCGGDASVSLVEDNSPSSWVQNPTIKALCSAFPGQVRSSFNS